MFSVTDVGEPSSNSRLVCCVHFRTNVLGKVMNLSLLPLLVMSRLGALTFSDNQSKIRKTLNSKLRRRQRETTPLFFIKMHGNSQIIKKDL